MNQTILKADDNYRDVGEYLISNNIKRLFLVCGKSFDNLPVKPYIDTLRDNGLIVVRFSDFSSNPTQEAVRLGVAIFNESCADAIFAIGGGSAMDVAKCVKLYGNNPGVPLMVAPTTAGTGSEATRFAVIYKDGEKQSITDDNILPNAILFDPCFLNSLKLYYRETAMLDALCHGIESMWSINSTTESLEYSKQAIREILKNLQSFLNNEYIGNKNMLAAANLAGKAINISRTTAGHAMSYKLSGICNIAHGHAVALCVDTLWHYMIKNTVLCVDKRGEKHLKNILEELSTLFNANTVEMGACNFHRLILGMKLKKFNMAMEDIPELAKKVNLTRLKNHPVKLSFENISDLYSDIGKKWVWSCKLKLLRK